MICKEQDNKGLFYHYNLQTKVQGTTAYVTAFPFVRGTALALPKGMVVADNTTNRTLMLLQNVASFTNWPKYFGQIISSEDKVLFDLPVTAMLKEKVLEKLKEFGNRTLRESEKKNLLLELTKEYRSYGLKETLSEDEWNY